MVTSAPTPRTHEDASPRSRGSRRLARPPRPRLLTSDATLIVIAIIVITTGLWWRNGGMESAFDSWTGALSSIGRISGLYAALAALAGLLLAARPRSLERRFGLDRMLLAHRIVGITTVILVTIHAITDTLAWGLPTGLNPVASLIDLMTTQPWMLAAVLSFLLFAMVGLTSWRRIRQRISYESWYFLHLTGYLAVLLGFGHQFTMGTDLVGGRLGLAWWVLLSIGTFAWIIWARFGDLMRSLTRGTLRVTAITKEADRMGSVHIGGPGLRRLRTQPGQFFHLRVLTRRLWWQTHPFSLSNAPTTAGLRFTIKDLGDGSREILSLNPGTRVLLEGPYGTFNAAQSQGEPVALFAGGAGIGPIRSILEDLDAEQEPVVILRARTEADIAHLDEIEQLVAHKCGRLHLVVGPRRLFAQGDPFHPQVLRQAVPDIAKRHAYLCGPESFEYTVEKSLRALRVPSKSIHRERFSI